MKKTLRVEWVEPSEFYDTTGAVEKCSISVEEAVARSRGAAATRNYVHKSDEDALIDFLVVNWADLVDTETGEPVKWLL
jgi:hypothetical protein